MFKSLNNIFVSQTGLHVKFQHEMIKFSAIWKNPSSFLEFWVKFNSTL